MLTRAKKIAAAIVVETATPAATMLLSHNLRGALADLAAELVDVNQRLDLMEKKADVLAIAARLPELVDDGYGKGGNDGKD